MEDQEEQGLRHVCEGKQKPQDNQRDYGQRDQLPTEERPVFAVREEVVNAFEGVKEGRADDVADGLEGGGGDGARVRHDKEEDCTMDAVGGEVRGV